MAKIQCYFDKRLPYGIVRRPSFYAYPIEVDENALKQAESLRELTEVVQGRIGRAAFPSGAQAEADYVAAELAKIMKIQKRAPKNVKLDNEEQSD